MVGTSEVSYLLLLRERSFGCICRSKRNQLSVSSYFAAPTQPPKDETAIKLAIMLTIPISSVLLMSIFVAYLWRKSYQEVKSSEAKTTTQHFVEVMVNSTAVGISAGILKNASQSQEPKDSTDKKLEQQPQFRNTPKIKISPETKTKPIDDPDGSGQMYKKVTYL